MALFYEDSEDELEDSWDNDSDISFNPWAKLKRSSSLGSGQDNCLSLASFRFSEQSPLWTLDYFTEESLSPLDVETIPEVSEVPPKKTAIKVSSRAAAASTKAAVAACNGCCDRSKLPNEEFLGSISAIRGKDLQTYVQTLLQGSVVGGAYQQMDLYQECLNTKPSCYIQPLSPKPAFVQRERDYNRASIISTASDASAVPSLVFSDADAPTRRPSQLLPVPSPSLLHRNSVMSLTSINTVASSGSWFLDDDSLPQSPVTSVSQRRASFARDLVSGISCFDDGDEDEDENEDEDEIEEELGSDESSYFILAGEETFISQPKTWGALTPSPILDSNIRPQITRSKLPPLPLPSLANSPEKPSTSASPMRRTRRRTASSECIVTDALQRMNEVMYEFANEDINRKSVVGLDLPGNQVSVEAYGELWW